MLSLPEVIADQVPPSIKALITSNTFILLNKLDLIPASHLADAKVFSQRLGAAEAWEVSLSAGTGTETFLDRLGKALQERYAPEYASW